MMEIRRLLAIALVTIVIAVSALVSCEQAAHRLNSHASEVAVGDTEASVIDRLGLPDVRESAESKPYLEYATSPCFGPCSTRLWWKSPFLSSVEAWSVEFDRNGKVLSTAHWVSP